MDLSTKYQVILSIPGYFVFAAFFILLSKSLAGQKDWALNSEKEGIRVYSMTIPGSKIKALRVTCTIEATLTQIASVILDIATQDDWLYNAKSVLLKQISPTELYYYTEISLPFPFNNRDYIGHLKLFQDTSTKILTMDVQNAPDYIAEKKGTIRIRQSASCWILRKESSDSVSIDFTLFVDPAGYIPYWLVNMFSKKGPFETFKKLKTHLKNARYLNITLPFVKN